MRGRTLLGILLLMLAVLFTPAAHAQTRVLIGGTGGLDFNNKTLGVTGGIEQPFAKHFEVDLYGTFSPLEIKTVYGNGFSYSTQAELSGWFNDHWGLNGRVDRSAYTVTTVSKTGYYAYGGASYRGLVGGLPAQFDFDFLKQFNNGIGANGTETNHIIGGEIDFSVRMGCARSFCVRMEDGFNAGRVLEQGNPACDGTFGLTGGPNGGPCARQATASGGFYASVVFEFPRRRGGECAE